MQPSLSNEYLVKLAAGEPVTTAHFVAHFRGLLRVKLRARMIGYTDSEEVQQETFKRVLTAVKQGTVKDGSRLNGFVIATCNHVLSEHFRHVAKMAPLDGHPGTTGEDAEEELLRAENQKKIQAVLDRMAVRDRQILKALFWEEQDKDEICSEHGVDRDYLRVLVYRAKANFKQEFQP